VTLSLGDPGAARGQAEAVRLLAAGSLRAALTEVAQAFTAAVGAPVTLEFGASGLLRERLGGPTSRPPPPDRSVHAQLLVERQADAFLTRCTNAAQAARELPSLEVVPRFPRRWRSARTTGSPS